MTVEAHTCGSSQDIVASGVVPPGWPMREYSDFVRAGDVLWHVQSVGDGPVLLLLHGAGASTHTWRHMVPELAAYFRLVMPDLPGHGLSQRFSGGDYTLPGTSQALSDCLKALGVVPSVILGHSAGAAIGLHWSMAQGKCPPVLAINPALLPFDGLAGVAFPAFARLAAQTSLVRSLLVRRARDPQQLMRVIAGTGSVLSRQGLDDYLRLMRRPDHVREVLCMMAGWDLSTLLDQLRSSEVLLHVWVAQLDRAVSPAATVAALSGIRNASIEKIAGLGHLAHEEAPEILVRQILEYCISAGYIEGDT